MASFDLYTAMNWATRAELVCLTIGTESCDAGVTEAIAGRLTGRPAHMEVNLAKDKKKPTAKKASKPRAKAATARAKPRSRAAKVTKAVRGARTKAAKIAANPAVAEIVAASLVAAAAAIKNPKKARDIATIVGAELETASKQAVDRGNAFWQLALDIAKRSMEALGGDSGGRKAKTGKKTKTGTKAKTAAKAKAKAKPKAKPKTSGKKKARK